MNAEAMVFAAFAADALALGGHWVYDESVIEKKYGRMDRYENPLGRSWHPTKSRGQFTHYGDQMLLLLEDIASVNGFDPKHFAGTWQAFFRSYDGYFDSATKTALERFRSGYNYRESGSDATDLAGAARICPLIYYFYKTNGNFLPAVRSQTAMTHNRPEVINSAVFFADVAFRVLKGQAPKTAIDDAIGSCPGQQAMIQWVRQGKESTGNNTVEAIKAFGRQCEVEAAFPGVIHLICKYEDNLKDALIENVMAGGDSAARGMMAGMILGAHNGMDAIPGHWLAEMAAFPRIAHLLEEIDR